MSETHVRALRARCGAELPDFDALPPFLRTLLVMDGTVTTCLEAFFAESVTIDALSQTLETLSEPSWLMQAASGETVIDRRVRLVGERTGCVYADAHSLVRVAALSEPLRAGLLQGRFGIGELLRMRDVETRRDIVRLFAEPSRGYVGRTYVIALGGAPALQVTEHFPLALYQAG